MNDEKTNTHGVAILPIPYAKIFDIGNTGNFRNAGFVNSNTGKAEIFASAVGFTDGRTALRANQSLFVKRRRKAEDLEAYQRTMTKIVASRTMRFYPIIGQYREHTVIHFHNQRNLRA